jgi:hypothetical protein
LAPISPSAYIAPLVEALKARPTSVALAGQDRVLLTQVAVGLAKRLDPEFLWFDIRPRGSTVPRWQSALEFGIGPSRIRVVDATEIHPNDSAAGLESAEPSPEGPPAEAPELGRSFDATPMPSPMSLDDLARLPESIRRAALEREPSSTPRVLLLTNVERASAAIDGAPGAILPYLEALNQTGVTVALTACSRPRANQHDVEIVLLVEPESENPHVPAAVVCSTVRIAGHFPAVPPGSSYTAESFLRD